MDDIEKQITHLEQLPDEIFLDLFENYVRLIDLYSGFYLLRHRRINAIIQSSRLNIAIPSKDIFDSLSFTHSASQILSLHLSTFCNDLDLSKFVNLRCLHLEKPTRHQLISIRAENLPQLHSLSLFPCWYSLQELPKHLTDLSQSSFSSFEYLRVCILPDGKRRKLHR